MQPGEEPTFMANILGNLIERKIALLTQSKPDIRVSARNPRMSKSADTLTGTIRSVLDNIQFDSNGDRAADLAATYGFCGYSTVWEPQAAFGYGDIQISVVDPRRIYVDPHVKSAADIQSAQYVRIDTPWPLWKIRKQWPGRGGEVSGDDALSRFTDYHEERSAGAGWLGGPLKRSLRARTTRESPYAWAFVKQYWLVSDQTSPTGDELFPAGRLIHRAGDVVLDDIANPYWDGLWPSDIWDWRVDGDSYMGRSDVEEMRRLQEAFIRLGHIITKNVYLNGSINVIGDWNALRAEDWKRLDNRSARIIKKAPGREFKFEPPPAFPREYLDLWNEMPRLMESVVGVPESVQGKRQPGVVASSAVEGLQVAAETLVRAAARRWEYVIERIGYKLISRIVQFYTSDRVMQKVGDGGETTDYAFVRNDLTDESGTPIDQKPEDWRRSYFSNFMFKVTPLSSLPANKIQRALLAQQLFDRGVVDDEEVLKSSEFPDWREVLRRTRQKQQSGQLPPPGGARPAKSNRRGTRMQMGS
jgi:hypothetical protein